MQNSIYQIKTMTRQEIGLAVEWAATEGWNPGLHDADCFYTADPNGFFIGLLDGKPVATISAVKYGNSFGFIGFYIVHPDYRGKGYGIQIWRAALEYLVGRNIGLDGVVAQQNNYKRSGFNLAYRNRRYQGQCSSNCFKSSKTTQLSSLDFTIVEAYDHHMFPENRSQFVQSWIKQADANALGVIENNELAGYGVIRKCYHGYKVGPLFADNQELAEMLLKSLLAGIDPAQPFYLDVPEVNRAAVALAERNNMEVVFETARMYTDGQPDIPLERLFGVTSFELG